MEGWEGDFVRAGWCRRLVCDTEEDCDTEEEVIADGKGEPLLLRLQAGVCSAEELENDNDSVSVIVCGMLTPQNMRLECPFRASVSAWKKLPLELFTEIGWVS
jgi:hypothetical protein